MIFLVGVFLRVLDMLPAMINCLFKSHLLDAVGDVYESVFDFLSRKCIHVTNLALLLLDITILVCGWM